MHLQVFQIAYCIHYNPQKRGECEEVCRSFVNKVCRVYPGFGQKPKIHLLLHLPECMDNFGPTAAYNTERYTLTCSVFFRSMTSLLHRCESFNSFIRNHNIHGNKRAPSRDIAYRFAVIEHIRYLGCSEKYSHM